MKTENYAIYTDTAKTPRERAEDLLSRMTLREKVGQVNQRLYGFSSYERNGDEITMTDEFKNEVKKYGGLGVLYGLYRADPWSQKDFNTGLFGVHTKRAYNIAQKFVVENSRFGIPMLMSSECPHGHQALDGYLLPVNLAVGAAFNPELTRKAYEVCGKQLKELGVDFALISMLDILRDPRWGRSEECYSEDPYLSAKLAKQAVLGCQSAGVPVVAKHFCAQGETTGGTNASAARIGGRELREIHLPAMKACCEADVAGVMAAYNEIDGVYCHANKHLLNDVLRGELGFNGVVMADGVAVDRLNSLTGDYAASGAMALNAGVEISLWDQSFSHLEEAVNNGLVAEEVLDKAVLKVLEMKFERGLFENPYLDETEPEEFTYEKYPESEELSRQIPVLLKNEGILPLKNNTGKIAVIGPNADAIYNQLGDYTPAQRDGAGVTVLGGVKNKFGGESVAFAQGCTVCGGETDGIAEAVSLAEQSDTVILVLGGSSSRFAGAKFDSNGAAVMDGPAEMDCGEGVDVTELSLPGAQLELLRAVAATGKPIITVIIAGRPYEIAEVCEKSNAVLYAFYPGPMGGKAIAEIILGEASPSGRLPASLPKGAAYLPCSYNYKSSYQPVENPWLFPFGFGLSYTRFELDKFAATEKITLTQLKNGERAEVKFTLKNTGDTDSYAVPQLFVHDVQASTVRRVKELKAFDKVFIKAGEEKQCVLTLGEDELALWNYEMKFTIEPGEFELFVEEGGKLLATATLTVI